MARRSGTPQLLSQERAFVPASTTKMDLKFYLKERRKFRKLRRTAYKKEVPLESLLRKRHRLRIEKELSEGVGKHCVVHTHSYSYVMEILSLLPGRKVSVRVVGYHSIRDTIPPSNAPYGVGTEHQIGYHRAHAQLRSQEIPVRTLEECAQLQIAHCDSVIASARERLDRGRKLLERRGAAPQASLTHNPLDVLVLNADQESDIRWLESWEKRKVQWMDWEPKWAPGGLY